MNQEQLSTMLSMLKIDLGVLSATAYDERFTQLLYAAARAIADEGAALDFSCHNDRELAVEYAAWLWRRRDSMEGMGRGLRYRLNNRVLAEKMRVPADSGTSPDDGTDSGGTSPDDGTDSGGTSPDDGTGGGTDTDGGTDSGGTEPDGGDVSGGTDGGGDDGQRD